MAFASTSSSVNNVLNLRIPVQLADTIFGRFIGPIRSDSSVSEREGIFMHELIRRCVQLVVEFTRFAKLLQKILIWYEVFLLVITQGHQVLAKRPQLVTEGP